MATIAASELAKHATGDLYYPDGETVVPGSLILAVEIRGRTIFFGAPEWSEYVEFGEIDDSPELAAALGLSE